MAQTDAIKPVRALARPKALALACIAVLVAAGWIYLALTLAGMSGVTALEVLCRPMFGTSGFGAEQALLLGDDGVDVCSRRDERALDGGARRHHDHRESQHEHPLLARARRRLHRGRCGVHCQFGHRALAGASRVGSKACLRRITGSSRAISFSRATAQSSARVSSRSVSTSRPKGAVRPGPGSGSMKASMRTPISPA